MSDFSDDREDDIDETTDDGDNLRRVRESRDRQEARAKEEAAAKSALAKENAWLKAGVDTDLPLAKTLLANYDGELTKEAVKAFIDAQGATPVLFPETPPPPADAELDQGEERSTEERSALAEGAEAPGGNAGANPAERMHENFRKGKEQGQSQDVAGAAALEEFLDTVASDPNSPFRLGAEHSKAS